MRYLCPLCQQPLLMVNRSWQCQQRHQFDIAREGYVNLLPVQHKRSKDPGDNMAMLAARREFLDGGHYQPLRQQIVDCLIPRLSPQARLLDIGCGEGYYTDALARALPQREVYGLDVAKTAIQFAARRYKNSAFCVASSQRLPFPDSSLDAVLRVYAPCNAAELARVIKAQGHLLTVTPGARHLIQLKALIYPQVKLHPEREESLPGFRPIMQLQLHPPLTLSSADARRLLQMTPFAWRASEAVWRTLDEVTQFHCETDFILRLWQRA